MAGAKKAILDLTVSVLDSAQRVQDELTKDEAVGGSQGALWLSNYFAGLAAGVRGSIIDIGISEFTPGTSSEALAQCSLTCTFNNTDLTTNDAFMIGPVTLTCKTTTALVGGNENNFLKGANATASASNFAAKVNAHSVLQNIVTASAALTKVTLTSVARGAAGQIRVASSDVSAIGFATDEVTVEATSKLALPVSGTVAAKGNRNYKNGIAG